MTNTSPSEDDSQVSKLKVCLSGHFNSGQQGHGKEQQLHAVNASTIIYPDSPPVSQQMTPPHSPLCSSPSTSTPGPFPSVSCEPSFSHTASLYALDTYQRSSSSSSLTTGSSSLSHLTTFQPPSSVRRHDVPNPTSSTWRPWNWLFHTGDQNVNTHTNTQMHSGLFSGIRWICLFTDSSLWPFSLITKRHRLKKKQTNKKKNSPGGLQMLFATFAWISCILVHPS